jgi:hypothetical protein
MENGGSFQHLLSSNNCNPRLKDGVFASFKTPTKTTLRVKSFSFLQLTPIVTLSASHIYIVILGG